MEKSKTKRSANCVDGNHKYVGIGNKWCNIALKLLIKNAIERTRNIQFIL